MAACARGIEVGASERLGSRRSCRVATTDGSMSRFMLQASPSVGLEQVPDYRAYVSMS